MRFAFFHGDPFTVLIIPGLIALLVGVALFVATALLFYISLTKNKLPPLYFTLPYVIPMALLFVLLAASSTGSGLYFISFGSSFGLSLPWSALGHWALRSGAGDSAAIVVFGAVVNTIILYSIGIVARKLKK